MLFWAILFQFLGTDNQFVGGHRAEGISVHTRKVSFTVVVIFPRANTVYI